MRKKYLSFYIMTVIFIAFIDTFSAYSADGAIFRIMVTGLLLLGLLSISRLLKSMIRQFLRVHLRDCVPLLFVVVVSGVFANILPKQEPVWPDPVPYFTIDVEGTGKVK